jgi:hypothetical protein
MQIIKGTDQIDVLHPVFMMFGQPGICKSSLGYSMRDALALDFDLGAHRAANRRDTLQVPHWGVVEELLADKHALDPYAAIVVDTVGRCLDVMIADMALKTPKLAPGGNPSQQGWGQLKSRFRTFIHTIRASGKDILLIAHDKEDKDGDVRVVRPEIVGGSYGEVMKSADFVGYLYMSGTQRILDFNPTDRWIGKNPAQWPPFQVPEVAKATKFFATLYDKGRDALGKISETSADALKTVESWREKIAGCATAAQCNALLPEIKLLPAVIQPQVAQLLWDLAKSAEIPFDQKLKAFVEPVKVVAPAEALPPAAAALFA